MRMLLNRVNGRAVHYAFEVTPETKSKRFRSGDLGGHCTRSHLPIHLSQYLGFICRLTIAEHCAGAPSCMYNIGYFVVGHGEHTQVILEDDAPRNEDNSVNRIYFEDCVVKIRAGS